MKTTLISSVAAFVIGAGAMYVVGPMVCDTAKMPSAPAALRLATPEGKTVASVNGHNITQSQVSHHMSQLPAFLIQDKEEQIKKDIIERLVEQELITQAAENMGLSKDDGFIKQMDLMTKTLTYNYLIQQKLEDSITPEALQAEYESAKEGAAQPAVKARHILVKDAKDAEAIIKKLDKGADFSELAKKESTGPSGPNGGDLGWFSPNDMVKTFSDAAFALEKGSYSKEPVQTQFGFHVIMVEDKQEKKAPSFEEMEDTLRKSLSERVINAYLAQLKADADITYADQ